MRSMTGYGRGSASDASVSASATARSVNHRGLDLAIRLRDEVRGLEGAIRRLVGGRIARGRVEIAVELSILDPALAAGTVDHAAVASILAAAREIAARHGVPGRFELGDLMRRPEVLRADGNREALPALAEAVVLAAVGSALDELAADRQREGDQLRAILGELLADLERASVALREQAPVAREALGVALRERLGEVLGASEIDPQRLAQEAAYLADRADVREELDRLATHLGALRDAFDAEEPSGKRIDVLTQEVLRELSTLGAKCRDGESKALALDARLVAERIREQAANVE